MGLIWDNQFIEFTYKGIHFAMPVCENLEDMITALTHAKEALDSGEIHKTMEDMKKEKK